MNAMSKLISVSLAVIVLACGLTQANAGQRHASAQSSGIHRLNPQPLPPG